MPNLVITKTNNGVKIKTNIYDTRLNRDLIGFSRFTLEKPNDKSIVIIHLESSLGSLRVAHTAVGNAMIVDTVSGIAPANPTDLFNKLLALM